MIKKYEYWRVRASNLTEDPGGRAISLRRLNGFGQDGWQLITYTFANDRPAFAYFMREIQTETAKELADSFYTLAPHYRTKEMLVNMIDGKYPKMSASVDKCR